MLIPFRALKHALTVLTLTFINFTGMGAHSAHAMTEVSCLVLQATAAMGYCY